MRRAARLSSVLTASLAVALGAAPPAHAEDKAPRACIASAEQGQLARYHGKLRSAREDFVRCARPECPDPIHTDCLRWLAEVDSSLPSVVLSAEWSDAGDDPSARDVLGLEVTVDGEAAADAASGRALSIDPGEHLVGFRSAGAIPVTMKVVIRQGEKNRALRASLAHVVPRHAPAKVASAGNAARPVPLASWITGGLGVAAIVDGVVWYAVGRTALDDQRSSCVHDCSSSAVDAERRKLLVGDISMAAGVVSLGVATYLYARRPEVARALARSPPWISAPVPRGGAPRSASTSDYGSSRTSSSLKRRFHSARSS